MHASEGGANSPPPFLTKTYDMVEDRASNDIVSWSPSNDSFVVRNVLVFSRDLLPKYFRHNNFSSFVRQLNTYGFRKIDPNQWEFANDEFVRGKRDLLKNIHRRKPIHSHSLNHQVSSTPLTETERQELEEKIGGLKYDKSMLLMELKAHVVEEHDMDHRMHVLEERLHVLEHRQKQLIAFLGHVLRKDSLPFNAIHLYETHGKKRRFLKPCYVGNDCGLEEDKIVDSQAMGIEKVDTTSVLFSESEMMESSLNSLENFFRRVSHVSGEAYDCATADGPSVVVTQMNTLLGNNDVNLPLESPELSSSFCFDGQSPSLLDYMDYTDSPVSSPVEFQGERSKLSEMDVNSEPSMPEEPSVCNQVEESASSVSPSGVNDVFWEHFLTEIPGSSSTEVFQPRSRGLAEDSSKVIFDALRSILTT